jgi:outer membrane protein TolC
VRDAARNVDITYRMLEASLKSMEAERKNYEAQEARFRAGLVSTLDMVIYQERLARAEINYIQGVIDYKKSMLQLAKAQGTTLIDENIKIGSKLS